MLEIATFSFHFSKFSRHRRDSSPNHPGLDTKQVVFFFLILIPYSISLQYCWIQLLRGTWGGGEGRRRGKDWGKWVKNCHPPHCTWLWRPCKVLICILIFFKIRVYFTFVSDPSTCLYHRLRNTWIANCHEFCRQSLRECVVFILRSVRLEFSETWRFECRRAKEH